MNYSILETQTTNALLLKIKNALASYEVNTGRSLRRDAVIAIEILFSVPASNSSIDLGGYFSDSLSWSITEFAPAELLTADVHLDESNPHLHVIFLCVTENRLVASSVTGYKKKYQDRRNNFYHYVAKRHGLELPPPALSRFNRIAIANQVIELLEQTADPITLSQFYPVICESIRQNPISFASVVGIPSLPLSRKVRTVAQIFTSSGRGPRWRKNE